MSENKRQIKRSLSGKLGTTILLIVIVGFILTLGLLTVRIRRIIKQEALEQASHVLDNTALKVQGCLQEMKTAANNTLWLIESHPEADSLLQYSKRVLSLYPEVRSCSIALENGVSACSSRSGNDIITTDGGNPYGELWYTTPKNAGEASWVEPFDEFTSAVHSDPDLIASYCVPLKGKDGEFTGVISVSLSLDRLQDIISAERPYKTSYCIILGADGHYFAHPDTTKIVRQTIFSEHDAGWEADINTLGNEMTSGHSGTMEIDLGGIPSMIIYRPLSGSEWSIALVYPKKEMLRSYTRLVYLLFPLLLLGIVLLVLSCRLIVNRFTKPLVKLTHQLQQVGKGASGSKLPETDDDTQVGMLQNSFASMLKSIVQNMSKADEANREARTRMRELEQATLQAQLASQQKTHFMQDISHQFRTPLNIILGFAQVLGEDFHSFTDEEKILIAENMRQSSKQLEHMVDELLLPLKTEKQNVMEEVDGATCVHLAEKASEEAKKQLIQDNEVLIESTLGEKSRIKAKGEYLSFILTELLVNALRSNPDAPVTLKLSETEDCFIFAVEDRGPGIPKDKADFVFDKFTKLDIYANGLGLGLYLARTLGQTMGGSLSLDKDYSPGCRFFLKLPK